MYTTRNEFGKLFQKHFMQGTGAEIGVRYGLFSKTLSKEWKGKIICVDLWENREIEEVSSAILEGLNVERYKGTSKEAAEYYADGGLDWVYIDAGHSYAEVKADFDAWYSKVRSGGIISGHDYGDNGFGVKKFIDEYIKLNPEIKMNFTTGDFWQGMEYQSWWFVKL